MKTYTERVVAYRRLSDEELTALAEGCTEITCLYHGPANQVRHERRLYRSEPS